MRQTNEGLAIAKVQNKHDLYTAMRTATKSMGSDGRHFNSDEEEGGDGEDDWNVGGEEGEGEGEGDDAHHTGFGSEQGHHGGPKRHHKKHHKPTLSNVDDKDQVFGAQLAPYSDNVPASIFKRSMADGQTALLAHPLEVNTAIRFSN